MAPSEPGAGDPLGALRARLFEGHVIPAHPLALDARRRLDARRQRALSRYYLDAGVGGLAVGVHTTQFAIRGAGLFEQVLAIAANEARTWQRIPESAAAGAPILIAGACGRTAQAIAEATIARDLGYDAALLSLAAMQGAGDDELIDHCQAVAEALPLVGFYLQPAVGGIALSAAFWARFAATCSCARACSRAPGTSIRPRGWGLARRPRSTGSVATMPISPTMSSSRAISGAGSTTDPIAPNDSNTNA